MPSIATSCCCANPCCVTARATWGASRPAGNRSRSWSSATSGDKANELARLVDRWGHGVRVAYDGVIGLRVAATQQPDVVLLDIALPLANECQVAQQLRLDFLGKKCFIIAATGRPDDASPEQCSAAGIDLVLIKPVDPSIVEALLMLECQRAGRPPLASAGHAAAQAASRFESSPVIQGELQ